MLEKDVQEKSGGNVSLRDAQGLGCCHTWEVLIALS